MSNNINVLIAVTGSVATVKLPLLADQLSKLTVKSRAVEVRVVATQNSMHFFQREDLDRLNVKLFTDKDEWDSWKKLSDPVLHVELRKWAHILLIAPIDANTLAKLACGLCDNLLTCTVRAWDMRKPLIFCPAMNTYMWEHPLTREHLAKLTSVGYIEIPVVSKKLACGDTGAGGMAEVNTIVQRVQLILNSLEA